MKIPRRKFLASLGGTALGGLFVAAYMRYFEPNWFEVVEKEIIINKLSKPLRILHLADFHASELISLSDVEKAIDISLQQNADVAFLTGDFITSKFYNWNEYARILRKLSSTMPTFACSGNHDGGLWAGSNYGYKDLSKVKMLLQKSDINLLFNQVEQIEINGQNITLVGLGDYWSDDTKPENLLFTERKTDEVILLLNHNPDAKESLRRYDWDIMFCGHTHGGQLVVPILGWRPFLPVRDKSFPEGIKTWNNKHIHITRGIGSLNGMRFNCRPEISIVKVS